MDKIVPMEALEGEAVKEPGHGIGWAVSELKSWRRVTRESWSEGTKLALVAANFARKTCEYIVLETRTGYLVPWTPSHADVLANDWRLYE